MTDDRLRELGKQLPWDRPDADRREAVRSALLVAAMQADPRATARKRWLLAGGGFAAGALAAAAIAIVVIAPRRDAGTPARQAHARVDAPATAQLEHTVAPTATGTDEVVRIRAGVVKLSVPAIAKGDRVRMQTADAEVEGVGTFEVAVADDRLERVTVTDGSAHVTTRGTGRQHQVFLSAGQSWRPTLVTADIDLGHPAPPVAAPPPATSPAPSAAPPVAEPSPREAPAAPKRTAHVEPPPEPAAEAPRLPAVTELEPAPATKSRTEVHFQAGWALLRDGKARQAAGELAAAADSNPDDPLAADARYFQAVALVKAGETREAERVLVAFVDKAPHSLRRGRAAILLGKLIRDRGDTQAARAWFESATKDADPAIAAAAKSHLDALASRR